MTSVIISSQGILFMDGDYHGSDRRSGTLARLARENLADFSEARTAIRAGAQHRPDLLGGSAPVALGPDDLIEPDPKATADGRPRLFHVFTRPSGEQMKPAAAGLEFLR
jgi:hypothetical protein